LAVDSQLCEDTVICTVPIPFFLFIFGSIEPKMFSENLMGAQKLLIKHTQEDFDSGPKHVNRTTYVNGKSRTVAISLVSLLLIIGVFIPSSTKAGIFSEWISIILNKTVEVSYFGSNQNVRTMSLPRAAMNIDPNPSKGGGDITIVDDSALLSEEGPAGTFADIEVNKSDQISVYVVRDGDTLSDIGKMFDVSVNTIIWANNLKNATIRPGQTLAILPVTGIKYTIKTGGTLRDVIKKHGGDLEEAELYNGIGADQELEAGTIVIIPEGEFAAPKTISSSTRIVRSSGGPSYDGYYIKPIAGGTRTQGIHGYNAVDIGAPVGTPVLAAASGDVIIVKNGGWNGGYGNYVVLRHGNGTQTLYAHNSSNIVYPGQSVVQGQVIGYVGSTGRSTGAHVHVEVRGAQNPF
jgi:murein DD-endopeptidase MepM/ murein hydrolase activator NlpD